MAQVKLLKINGDGWQEEHGTADDVTFATVTGTTEISVTSGVTIGSDITFNAVDDTIAGIENQNLVDKTATETIAANWTVGTGYTLTLTDAPSAATDAANKAYVDSVATGLDWQDSVLDRYDPTTATPAGPSTGDRYIATATANGWTANNIYEWNGTSWDETVTNEGFAVWVEDENVVYVFDGTNWVKFSSVVDHNNLSNIQGGTSNEYYHATSAENTWLTTVSTDIDAANVADLSDNETLSGAWTVSGALDVATGEFTFPNAASATPGEGDTYWDGTANILYVYDGASWVDVSTTAAAEYVGTTYTTGTGGVTAYQAVYISGNDTVLPTDADAIATSKAIGFAKATVAQGNPVSIQENGVLAGALSGATAGTVYFLSTSTGAISTSRPTGSGDVVYKVGYAKNATDLHIQLDFIGIRS